MASGNIRDIDVIINGGYVENEEEKNVTSVNGMTGDVQITKETLGIENVDNTSDLNKPVSIATQTALNAKANASDLSSLASRVTNFENDVDENKANVDGTNATGTWGIDISGNAATATKATSADSAKKATQDGNGKEISKTYLPLAGGTMDKDAKVKISKTTDDRYAMYTNSGVNNYIPSDSDFSMGLAYFNQDAEQLGGIGLYGEKDSPQYYHIGGYSDPCVKVDMNGNTTVKKNLSVKGTINKLITQYIHKDDNGGNPTFLLAYDVTSMYKDGIEGNWGFNGIIYSARTVGYINHEGVARIIIGATYKKATAIGSTLRLATDDGNYRPCLIHDTANDKYYLAIRLYGLGRNLVFQGYARNDLLMGTTQLNGTSARALPSGYEFVVAPEDCTMGIGVSTSCTGNSETATKATQDASGNVITDTYAKKSIYNDTVVSMGRKADTTVGTNSFAFGNDVTASGQYSCATGSLTTASGDYSFASGLNTTADDYSCAQGVGTRALYGQHVIGHHNITTTQNSISGTSTGTAFCIGNGTSYSKSNAFRVTGDGYVYSAQASMKTGADYSELFEWQDENKNNEDRVGKFVTFDTEKKIRIANKDDDYILGIVSGNPAIIGNADECWRGRYVTDNFGRFITEEVEEQIEEINEETGETETKTIIVTKWKENEEYDPQSEYIQRIVRKEWEAIGMLGVLPVYDDGTCTVHGYCTVSDGGIATACVRSDSINTYKVLKRVTDNIVEVLFK